ncbi:hypothetical protein P7C71_g1770, partial [Lecanoromycetidae sp. Uapishka_2]
MSAPYQQDKKNGHTKRKGRENALRAFSPIETDEKLLEFYRRTRSVPSAPPEDKGTGFNDGKEEANFETNCEDDREKATLETDATDYAKEEISSSPFTENELHDHDDPKPQSQYLGYLVLAPGQKIVELRRPESVGPMTTPLLGITESSSSNSDEPEQGPGSKV